MLVVQTFSGDKIRFNMYATIGWGEWISLSGGGSNTFFVSQGSITDSRRRVLIPTAALANFCDMSYGGPLPILLLFFRCRELNLQKSH